MGESYKSTKNIGYVAGRIPSSNSAAMRGLMTMALNGDSSNDMFDVSGVD